MKYKHEKLYMDIALRIAKMSTATDKQVGAVLVKDDNIISFGWNGTPNGFDNICEYNSGKTKSEVIHAEMNAYAKLARLGISAKGSILFLTLSPCFNCSKLIIQSGTIEVLYFEKWKDNEPLEFLRKAGVFVGELQ